MIDFETFVVAVAEMRQAQKEYLDQFTDKAKDRKTALEKEVDRHVTEILRGLG